MKRYDVSHVQHKKKFAFSMLVESSLISYCISDSERFDVSRAVYAIANHSAGSPETLNTREIFVAAYIDYGFHTKPDFILATR
jgi:hypothetical protein